MNKNQFEIFKKFREEFKAYCEKLNSEYSEVLKPLQKSAAEADTPDYPVENAIVYNTALDEITEESEIRIIVIGDNPGKDEQLSKNRKYLVGQSGKIAAGFFKKNPEFNADFRKNAIILNKTPIHTAKTKHLKTIAKNNKKVEKLIEESQIFMAQKTAELHQKLLVEANGDFPELWLVGYAELKGKGIFIKYRDELKNAYNDKENAWNKVFVFQHFSMNRFSIDLKNFMQTVPQLPISKACEKLGEQHKKEIFI